MRSLASFAPADVVGVNVEFSVSVPNYRHWFKLKSSEFRLRAETAVLPAVSETIPKSKTINSEEAIAPREVPSSYPTPLK